jgi:nitrogen regulatory protein P-II 1
MVKIEAIVRPDYLDALQHELAEVGHAGLTVSQVQGSGTEPRPVEWFRGLVSQPRFLPKVKIELVLPDAMLEEALWVIRNTCYTGEAGDGRIFVSPVKDAIRIRTGERGYAAL